MDKRLISFTLLCFSLSLWAEPIPQGYYNAIQGKTDAELKTALSVIIRGGQRYNYGSQDVDCHTQDKIDQSTGDTLWKKGDPRYGTWTAFVQTDLRSDGTIWDMYSTTKRYFPINGGSAAGLDIEHCFPKSWWGGQDSTIAATDLYLLNPADRIANNNKSNYPPGRLVDSSKVNNGIFFMGKDATWGGYAFSIIDEYKGDFARAYFYVVTAYEYYQWNQYPQYINKDNYQGFVPYLRDILLEWHRLDPVSQKEIDRINAISAIQHNRNPFIDYPDLVEYIWGNKQGQTVHLEDLICTTNGQYIVPISNDNPTAFAATNICCSGFTAHWSNTGSDSYRLNVFTRKITGHNDTIIALPGFKSNLIKADNRLHWCNADGSASTYNNMDGSYATCMSTTSALKQLRLTDFGTLPANAYLSVKCCVFKNDNTADLVIKGDNDEVLYTQPLVLDEQFYTFAIPEGTKTLSIWQKEVGKSGNYHRVSLQQVFLYTGDKQITETSIEGYPVEVTENQYNVFINGGQVGQTYFYNVTPKELKTTNTIGVTLTSKPCSSMNTITPLFHPTNSIHKVLIDGHIYLSLPYSPTPLPLYSL